MRIVARCPSERWEVVRIEMPASVARYVVRARSATEFYLTVSEPAPGSGTGLVSLIRRDPGALRWGPLR